MVSEIFIEFIKKHPVSSSAREWNKWGTNIPMYSGKFTCELFAGNVELALMSADPYNKALLKDILQD